MRERGRRAQREAEELRRDLVLVEGLQGVPWVDAEGLWLLERPAPRSSSPGLLAGLLTSSEESHRRVWAEALGARDVWRVTAGRLGRASRALSVLRRASNLGRLLRDGVEALRRFRGEDIEARLAAAEAALEALSALLTAWEGWSVSGSAEGLVLWTRSLGVLDGGSGGRPWWSSCEDEGLRSLSTTGPELRTRCVASAVLGARARAAGGGPRGLDGAGYAAWALGNAWPGLSPLLIAALVEAGREQECAQVAEWVQALGVDAQLGIERCLRLYGLPFALGVLESCVRGRQEARWRREQLRHHRERFLACLHGSAAFALGHRELRLIQAISHLPEQEPERTRGLVAAFVEYVGGRERLVGVSLSASEHSARSAFERGGLLEAASALVEWVSGAVYEDQGGVGGWGQEAWNRLELALAHPAEPLLPPPGLFGTRLVLLVQASTSYNRQAVAQIGAALAEADTVPSVWDWRWLLERGWSVGSVMRCVRLGVVELLSEETSWGEDSVRRYLDALEALPAGGIAGINVRARWFLGLVQAGHRWTPALLRTWFSRRASQGGLDAAVASLYALAHAVGLNERGWSAALARWSEIRVERRPAEFDAVAQTLDVPAAELDAYLHHRRLTGAGEVFSAGLLEVLKEEGRRAREAAHLTQRLAEGRVEGAKAEHMALRLAALQDDGGEDGWRAQAARRARNRLTRGLEQLRRESLERVLDDATRAALEAVLERPLPAGPLPDGLRDAILLVEAQSIKEALLCDFLRDVVEGRSLAERPQNVHWLERMSRRGMNTAAWLRGVEETIEIGGAAIRVWTEADPLHVLKMGTYFDTCLRLEGGENAASTLVNALDVNKHVIYGRRVADGVIVCRKLIGVTAQGNLVGYRTYTNEDGDNYRMALGGVASRLAERCGLRLADQGTPEVLHDGFWYDDGVEVWWSSTPQLPEGVAENDVEGLGAVEYGWRRWHETGEVALLRWLARRAPRPLGLSAAWRLLRQGAATAEDLAALVDRGWVFSRLLRLLVVDGQLGWVDTSTGRRLRPSMVIGALMESPAGAPWPAILSWIRARSGGRFRGAGIYEAELRDAFAAAPTGWLVELAVLVQDGARRSSVDEYDQERWCLVATDLLVVASLRQSEPRALTRLLESGDRFLEDIGLGLTVQLRVPGVAPALRQIAARSRGDRLERVALALARQGHAEDGERLLRWLERDPRSRSLAVAAARLGDPDTARRAAALWVPDDGAISLLGTDGAFIDEARAIQSGELLRRLRRWSARWIERGATLEPAELDANCAIAIGAACLGADAEEMEPWLRSVGEHLEGPNRRFPLDEALALMRESFVFEELLARVEPTEAWVLALRQVWVRARDRVRGQVPGIAWPFPGEHAHRALLEVIGAGDAAAQAAALETLLVVSPSNYSLFRRLVFAGIELDALPEALRARLGCAALTPNPPAWLGVHVGEVRAALRWWEGLSAEAIEEALAAGSDVIAWSSSTWDLEGDPWGWVFLALDGALDTTGLDGALEALGRRWLASAPDAVLRWFLALSAWASPATFERWWARWTPVAAASVKDGQQHAVVAALCSHEGYTSLALIRRFVADVASGMAAHLRAGLLICAKGHTGRWAEALVAGLEQLDRPALEGEGGASGEGG